MKAYYNEIDKNAAAWLRQLIKNGDITEGEVDERSIIEVEPSDLRGFDRCHFFAGIGTWDYCLNESGWTDGSVWTASLPCQPFSVAGQRKGKDDERHLLPHFLELVRQCKPDAIFGEQVEGAVRHGWLDDLYAEMEAENYAVGSVVLGAHSINAAHKRQRIYWVAHTRCKQYEGCEISGKLPEMLRNEQVFNKFERSSGLFRLADTESGRRGRQFEKRMPQYQFKGGGGRGDWVVQSDKSGFSERMFTSTPTRYRNSIESTGSFDIVECRERGKIKYRPVPKEIKPCLFPLADGFAGSMVQSGDSGKEINENNSYEAAAMRLKGYGNAIVAGVAIEFIRAFMSIKEDGLI